MRRFRQRAGLDRGAAAGPSEEGGLEEFVEFFLRPASWRSRSAICLSRSALCFPDSSTFSRSRSLSVRSRWFSRRSWSGVNDRRSAVDEGRFNRCPDPLGFVFDALIHHTILDGAPNVQRFRRGAERLPNSFLRKLPLVTLDTAIAEFPRLSGVSGSVPAPVANRRGIEPRLSAALHPQIFPVAEPRP